MSVFPCSVCKERRPGKLAAAYWAWFNADGNRSAWHLRYCPVCAVANLRDVLSASRSATSEESAWSCVSCGMNAQEDHDPIYLTLYLPSKEPEEFALVLDSACAAKLRIPIVKDGKRLPDRGGVVGGPQHEIPAWDALGLSPE